MPGVRGGAIADTGAASTHCPGPAVPVRCRSGVVVDVAGAAGTVASVIAALPPLRPVRSTRTFAFVDLCGFTDFVEDSVDDDGLVAELLAVRTVLRHVASSHGVRIASWAGDGAMLVGVTPGPTIAAVVDSQTHLASSTTVLALRAGIATGAVALFDGHDYVGRAANLASRLCDLAGPHQILLPSSLTEHLPDAAAPLAIGARTLRGISAPVDVIALNAHAS